MRRDWRRGHDQPGGEFGLLRWRPNAKNSVCLVDLDLSLGDADVFLDTIPDYTLVDVAQNVTRLDFTLLKRSLTKHSSGLVSVAAAGAIGRCRPHYARRFAAHDRPAEGHVHAFDSRSFEGLQPLDMVALETATHVLLVTQLDLPCLRNVVRLMMSFGEINGLKDKVKIVVNRVGLDAAQISMKKAQETIGREIFWQLPNDYRTMSEVRNNGVPLIEQAPKAADYAIDSRTDRPIQCPRHSRRDCR